MAVDAKGPKAWIWFGPMLTILAAFPRVPPASVPCAAFILAVLVLASWRRRTLANAVEEPLCLAFLPPALALVVHIDALKMQEHLGFIGTLPYSHELSAAPTLVGGVVLAIVTATLGVKVAELAAARHLGLVRVLAWLATVFACAALGVTAMRIDRPTPSAYPSRLPVLGILDAPAEGALRGARTEQVLGDVRVTRAPAGEGRDGCIVWMARVASGARPPDQSWAWVRLRGSEPCGALLVRADDARHLWVLGTESDRLTAIDQLETKSARRPRPGRLAGALRPPNAYVGLAVVGVLGALASLLRRRSELPRDEGACRDGFVHPDGTITVAGAVSPVAAPRLGPALAGPVVVILGRANESFREHAGPAVVRMLPGTLDEHRRAALAAPAFALAFVGIAVTPLVVMLLDLG
jgi:hypothetical protein